MEREQLLYILSDRPARLKEFPEVQDDTELIREVAEKNGWILRHASERLRGDLETVLLALKNQGGVYPDVSEELKGRRDVVLAAVSSEGEMFAQIPEEFRTDREIALAAARDDGVALQYMPEHFREDREIILAASRWCSAADVFDNLLKFIPKRFLSDKEVAINLVGIHGYLFDYVDKKFTHDIDVLEAAVKRDPYIFEEFDEEIRGNKEYVKRFLPYDVTLLYHASEELKADKEMAMLAMHHPECRYALRLLAPELQTDEDVLRAYVANFEVCYARAYAFDENIKKIKIPEKLIRDDGFMNAVLDIYFDQEELLENDTAMGKDKTFVLRAIELGRDVSKLAAPELLEDEDIQAALLKAEKRKQRKQKLSRFLKWWKR